MTSKNNINVHYKTKGCEGKGDEVVLKRLQTITEPGQKPMASRTISKTAIGKKGVLT